MGAIVRYRRKIVYGDFSPALAVADGKRQGIVGVLMDERLTEEEQKDEEILARSLSQPSLFEVLLTRYQEAFLRKAESIIGNRQDAEDIVQDTFTKIYLHAPSFHPVEGASFRSWAYKILINTALTLYQKRKRIRQATITLDPELYEALPDKNDVAEQREMKDMLESVFKEMPDDLARALRMHFLEGLPHREIAAREGVSEGAIKTRVHRAKKKFKQLEALFIHP
jgi:RNA polymerase sigma-70 factor (ECF subfamily)